MLSILHLYIYLLKANNFFDSSYSSHQAKNALLNKRSELYLLSLKHIFTRKLYTNLKTNYHLKIFIITIYCNYSIYSI